MWHCVCSSKSTLVPTPHCLECVHASVHAFMLTWPPVLAKPLWIVTWRPGFLYVSLCVCPSQPACGPTPWLKYVHTSVHVYMSTWLTMSVSPLLNSYMETWVPYVGLWLCLNDPTSVPIPWLACAHASVHVCMCTWLCMSAPTISQRWEL